jgi:hypothetical protein
MKIRKKKNISKQIDKRISMVQKTSYMRIIFLWAHSNFFIFYHLIKLIASPFFIDCIITSKNIKFYNYKLHQQLNGLFYLFCYYYYYYLLNSKNVSLTKNLLKEYF